MSGYVRVYIKTFDSGLNYNNDYIEVTSDVELSSLSNINQKLDNNKFDVGTFKYTDFSFTINNDTGLYSEPEVLRSIFINKRKDSLVKVTWTNQDIGAICGFAICGESYLSDENVIFIGLLNDISSTQSTKDAKIKFSAQGIESIFESTLTNFSSLSASDNISVTIYKLLNQTRVTDLMTVSQSNISCGIDQALDSVASLEETTVKEALDELLEKSNSILYVDSQVVYVKPRTADASISKTFYGQGSNSGSEDIVNISQITPGLNKMFNIWKWKDTTTTSKDTTSIDTYGIRKKEISTDLITNGTKIQNILDSYKNEFANPKQELRLTTILDNSTVSLFLLNRVVVDYPTVFYPVNNNLPRFSQSTFGNERFPFGAWNLTILTTKNFKILGRSINLKNNTVDFDLREI